jgi:hypothetical protein
MPSRKRYCCGFCGQVLPAQLPVPRMTLHA